jgi:hypothetical protein
MRGCGYVTKAKNAMRTDHEGRAETVEISNALKRGRQISNVIYDLPRSVGAELLKAVRRPRSGEGNKTEPQF